jgi:hypothetical protein
MEGPQVGECEAGPDIKEAELVGEALSGQTGAPFGSGLEVPWYFFLVDFEEIAFFL